MLTSVDVSVTQHIDVFDITLELLLLHIMLVMLVHSLNVLNYNSGKISQIVPLILQSIECTMYLY